MTFYVLFCRAGAPGAAHPFVPENASGASPAHSSGHVTFKRDKTAFKAD